MLLNGLYSFAFTLTLITHLRILKTADAYTYLFSKGCINDINYLFTEMTRKQTLPTDKTTLFI